MVESRKSKNHLQLLFMLSHQDKIAANNAFWREMLDMIPASILIFRIDEDEQAQLFFVNSYIRRDLGFTSEEYVLGSETEGTIAKELNGLIDKIADLSHKDSIDDKKQIITLTSRDELQVTMQFDFRIFQSKTSRKNLISVSLFPLNDSAEVIGSDTPKESSPRIRSKELMQPVFVAESPIMQAVVDKIDHLTHQDSHIIIHGEKYTGKKTLVQRMFNALRLTSGIYDLMYAELTDKSPEEALPELFDGPVDAKVHALAQSKNDLIVALADIDNIPAGYADRLTQLVSYRERVGLKTRLILTTKLSLEQLVEKNIVPADLLYRYTFISVPVPPLRHRKDDIGLVAEKWTMKLSAVLGLQKPEFTETQLNDFRNREWKNNFKELFAALRQYVIEPELDSQEESRTGSKKEQKSTPVKETDVSGLIPDEVISFDDMNRKYLKHVLKITKGKIYGKDGAAAMLKMKPTTLQSKLKKLKIR